MKYWILPLSAAAVLVVPGAGPSPESLLGPLFVEQPEGGPLVVARPQPESPLVALRLSVPLEGRSGGRGVARVLQHLVRERVEADAAAQGARVWLAATPAHAVYGILGPVESFDALVEILRQAAGLPDVRPLDVEIARAAAAVEESAAAELPEALLRRRLRQALFPSLPAGDGAAVHALTAGRLREFWNERYRPERMQVVVVGGLAAPTVIAAFRDWRPTMEARLPDGLPPPSGTEPGRDSRPQALYPWAGVGYPAEGLDAASLAIAALLVEARLADQGVRKGSAEAWCHGERCALVVIGAAAASGVDAKGVARRLRAAVSGSASRAGTRSVAEARRTLRNRILFAARTPDGLATVLGEFAERTGDPRGAERFLDALDRADAASVRSVLRALAEREPVTAEVDP